MNNGQLCHYLMPQTEIYMQRTLHPIGQGGFYTEQFLINDVRFEDSSLFNVVYDCGSESSPARLEDEIKATFPRGSNIDILFISHFDRDHINGIAALIERCNLKKKSRTIQYVVLPLLNDRQKVIAFLETGIDNFEKDALRERFNANEIIFVKPISESYVENNVSRSINEIRNDIDSGVPISVDALDKWVYIPFNAIDSEIYNKFLEFIEKENNEIFKVLKNTSELDINSVISKILDDKTWDTVKKLYRKFHKEVSISKNSSSLIVYSGPSGINAGKPYTRWRIARQTPDFKLRRVPLYNSSRYAVGALYTGDIKLGENINTTPSISVLQYIVKTLSPFIPYVGLIQVPHHGSKYNFDPDLIHEFPQSYAYFMSYGLDNHYKHPYPGIKMTLLGHNKKVLDITENPDSEFLQIIKN